MCMSLSPKKEKLGMVRRTTVMIDDDLVKKLRIMQAKMIQNENKSVSFSHVVNLVLRDVLKK